MKYTDRQIKLAYKNGVIETIKNTMIEAEIAKKYSMGAQVAILRQGETKPEEFAAFNAYAEECKAKIKEYLSSVLGIPADELSSTNI